MSKQLKRSRIEKSIHGVCGGLANHFDVPPFLVRLLFIFTLPGSFFFLHHPCEYVTGRLIRRLY